MITISHMLLRPLRTQCTAHTIWIRIESAMSGIADLR